MKHWALILIAAGGLLAGCGESTTTPTAEEAAKTAPLETPPEAGKATFTPRPAPP